MPLSNAPNFKLGHNPLLPQQFVVVSRREEDVKDSIGNAGLICLRSSVCSKVHYLHLCLSKLLRLPSPFRLGPPNLLNAAAYIAKFAVRDVNSTKEPSVTKSVGVWELVFFAAGIMSRSWSGERLRMCCRDVS
jgi:hypothetical protein